MSRAIGGFLPLRLHQGTIPAESALTQWIGDREAWVLHNARSALHALWNRLRPRRVWLPAYVCAEVAAAVPIGVDTGYFPLGEDLAPHVDFLSAQVQDGDHVLAIDYFGRPANPEFFALVRARPAVGWIEDRAQALDPPADAWGDWLLYSPRKLLGVPDGGILVAHRKSLWPLDTRPAVDLAFALPSLERFEDCDETDNQRWYATYLREEAAMTVGLQSMSRLSLAVLKATDAKADSVARRGNYQILYERLRKWAFLPDPEPSFAPLGFPIRVQSAATMSKRLADRRVFAARHWQSLPSDPALFAFEHRLAQELLTLPCDYRYSERDMRHVADAVHDAMATGG
jgi:hypothetical protein